MCGLVGIAGKLEAKDENTLKRLLVYDYFRGPDSTGFAAVRNTREVKVAKVSSHPLDLFEMQSFKTALSGYNSTVFLGHNRAATRGVVTSYNAHPFEVDHIVGAHNGTLFESSHKALEEKLGEKFTVDSHAVITAIARLGVEATIPLLTGAWALTWYNSDDNTLNFIRNKERPLWYAYTKEFNRIFWSSEWPVMDAATKLSTLGYELHLDEEGFGFWSFEEDVWYSYDVDTLKAGSSARPKPKAKVLKGKEVVVPANHTDPFRRSPNGTGTSGGATTQTGTSTTTTRSGFKDKTVIEVLNLDGSEENPYAGIIKKEKFEEISKGGCAWCEADIKWGDIVTICENEDIVRCAKCSPGSGDSSRLYLTNFQQLL